MDAVNVAMHGCVINNKRIQRKGSHIHIELDGVAVSFDCDMRCEALNIDYWETNSSQKMNNVFYDLPLSF